MKGKNLKNLFKNSLLSHFVYAIFLFLLTLLAVSSLSFSTPIESLSVSQPFATLWTVALQAPVSMGFSKQEYWGGCHFLLQGIFMTQE